MPFGRIALTIVVAVLGPDASAQVRLDVPIYVGGDADLDACPSTGDRRRS
jgi:hypothetical protein